MSKPNASIMTLLTLPDSDSHKVIAVLAVPIEDVAPVTTYWYDKLGKNGKARLLWPENSPSDIKGLKQWLVVAEDNIIIEWYNELIKNGVVDCGKGRTFQIEILKEEEPILVLERYAWPGTGHLPMKLYKLIIPLLPSLKESDVLGQLEGNKISQENVDYPHILEPPGLLCENKLKNWIGHAILNNRFSISYSTLHGVPEPDSANPRKKVNKTLRGFIQADPDARENMEVRVIINNLNANKPIQANIDPKTGIWEIRSKESVTNGTIKIFKQEDENILIQEDFSLIQSFEVNLHVVHTETKDPWGRVVSISSSDSKDSLEKTNIEKSIVWSRSNYVNDIEAQIALCDKLYPILSFLGPTILITDPFLFGDFDVDEGIIKLTPSQKVFFGALIWAQKNNAIKEIFFLGKQKFTSTDTVETLIQMIKNLQVLAPERITIRNPMSIFHDRHWIGIRENRDESIVYQVGNSISGIATGKDLSISRLEGIMAEQIITNRLNQWENAVIVKDWRKQK